MYTSSWRPCLGAMSNLVRIVTEAASLGGERQSMNGPCEKIFGYPHWQLSAPLHEAPIAKGLAREGASYFHKTLLSN